jgi:hypothetical protein
VKTELFTEFYSRHELVYMVFADLFSKDECSLGAHSGLIPNGLIALVSDLDTLDRSLVGQILPISYSQGREACFVTKPTPNTIAVLYFYSTKEFFEEIEWGKELDRELRQLITTAG